MTASEYAYQYEKQSAAQLALGRLLSQASEAGLRPLSWTVSPHGVLLGKATGAQRRAELEQLFEQWADFLGNDLAREDDDAFTTTTDVIKNAVTKNAPGAGKDIEVRLRITVTSDWEKYL